MVFRSDIEGLRGVAVISVLGFHLNVAGMQGGFVGVDIFFVISGFLMAQIIANDLAKDRFSIWGFYFRRILRIWPAMLATIAGVLFLGLLALFPTDLMKLAKAALASLFLVNNVLFALEGRYFDGVLENNALLHLWSLAVEQQFYLVVPVLLLFVVSRGSQPPRAWLLVTVFLASLTLSAFLTTLKPNASFYLLPTRIWEFLLGSAVALGVANWRVMTRYAEIASAAGLALILIAVVALDNRVGFPGYVALIPALGAALVIAGGLNGTTATGTALSTSWLCLVGRWSYSLYLWHWPIITFSRMRGFPIDTVWMQALIVLLSLAAASLSWRFIELPFRISAQRGSLMRKLSALAAAVVVLMTFAASVVADNGMPARLSATMRAYEAYASYPERAALYREGSCFIADGQPASAYDDDACRDIKAGRKNLLLWGDSHAAHLVYGLRQQGEPRQVGITQATYGGCAPIPFRPALEPCRAFAAHAMSLATSGNFDAVILAADWLGYPSVLPELAKLVDVLGASNQRVIIVGPTMRFPPGLPMLLASRGFGILPSSNSSKDWLNRPSIALDRQMAAQYSDQRNVIYFSPIVALCPDGNCPVLLDGGVPLTWDSSHLTREGSVLSAAALLKASDAFLSPRVTGSRAD